MADILYVDDDYVASGYVSATRDGAGAFSTASTLSATPVRIRDAGLQTGENLTWDDQSSWDLWLRDYWDSSDQQGIILPAYSYLVGEGFSGKIGYAAFLSAFATDQSAARIRTSTASYTVTATLAATPTRTRSGSSAFTSQSTVAATGIRAVFAQANFASTVTVSGTAERTRTTSGAFASAVTTSATPLRTRPGSGSFATAITTQITPLVTRPGASAVVSEFIVDVNGGAVTLGESDLSSRFTCTTAGSRAVFNGVEFAANFTTTAIPLRRRPGLATASSAFAFGINAGPIRNFSAALNVQGFVLTAGDVFTLDPDFQLRVTPESRLYPVLVETRLLAVDQETRVNIILPDMRTHAVASETRTLEVL